MTKICRRGFLSSFILVSYIAVTTSMMLDLTELRNKISKLKVNPRGNLWATGHFMGKKSVGESSLMESAFEQRDMPSDGGKNIVQGEESLQEILIQMLKRAKHTEEKTINREGGDPV
ncbi:neuromedin Ba [Austrofundulus limnaeus]|uniref:Neuromedin Ba n=1 Tax=Austrofundulus limnaeus TaxID=52670 RepID=A0A2I4AU42_AUSLI|nr:PREDICTED: neuromedin-B [Austrofundulus limnaeus]